MGYAGGGQFAADACEILRDHVMPLQVHATQTVHLDVEQGRANECVHGAGIRSSAACGLDGCDAAVFHEDVLGLTQAEDLAAHQYGSCYFKSAHELSRRPRASLLFLIANLEGYRLVMKWM